MSVIAEHCRRLFLTTFVAIGLSASAAAENLRLAVFDFDTLGPGLDEKLGRAVAQVLQVSLINQKTYDIVERSHLAKIAAEQDLQVTGMVDPQTCIKVGKLAGAQFAVVGSVMRFEKTYVINWAIVDVQTARVAKGENMVFATEDLLPAVCQRLGTAIVEDSEGSKRQAIKGLFADAFKHAQLDESLWRWSHTTRLSYQGTGRQSHEVSTKDGYLLIDARAEHDRGWTSIEDVWVDSLIDLRSDDDVIVELELAAEARCGVVQVKLSEGREPEARGDPASITLFSAQGEKHNPLSIKSQKMRIEVCGSAQMATLYTQDGMLPDSTNVDLSALKSWRLRFYASAGTSAGFPPASAVLKLYAVRAARVESKPAIAGRIVDTTTNRGIPGASVTIKGQHLETMSNPDGTYVLLCPPGQYAVTASVTDYALVEPIEVRVVPSKRAVANISMKRTKFGYGDVLSAFSVGKQNCHAIAVASDSIFYVASSEGEKPSLYRAKLDGTQAARLGELSPGGCSGLGFVQGTLYGTDWWPGRLYRISTNGQATLVKRLDIDWPRGLAFDGSNLWYLETSSIDNKYGAYAVDAGSGGVVIQLEGRDTKISGIAWGKERLWVSSLKGQVYEVDVNRAKQEGSLEAGIVRKFAGQYDRLSYEGGYLWGLDAKANRICKINLD